MIEIDRILLPTDSFSFEFDTYSNRFLICQRTSSKIYILKLRDDKLHYSHSVDLKVHQIYPISIRISNKKEIFVSCKLSRSIFIFDYEFNLLRRISNTAAYCFSIAINDDGSQVFIASMNENIIQKFDALNCNLIYELKVRSPVKIDLKNDLLYVVGLDSLIVLNSKDGSLNENILIERDVDSDTVFVDNDDIKFVVVNNKCNEESKYLCTVKRANNNSYSISKEFLCECREVRELAKIGNNLFILTHEEECDIYFIRMSLE